MIKPIPLTRAVATATVALGACLPAPIWVLAGASPAAAFTPSTKTGGENTPLELTTTSSGGSHPTSGGGASLVRTIVGLAIVIAVIWGLAWILKQVKAGKDPNVSSAGLASVAALTLGSGRTVHLVRAGSDYVLLGATEHGLAPIHRYTEAQAREAGLFVDEPAPERSRIVAAAGQLLSGPRREYDMHSPAVGDRPDPMRAPAPAGGLIERLREMTVRR
ncbi:MAG TPA: flagellar biosynthetic protein FliO [Solirubrobacteraceae bacterium]|nr:flagellar biosynthetic protein FliO [Solirubrobacteraceae bacterium]